MTPLIDVVFLLLIFFLVASVFKRDESVLKLTLPEIETKTEKSVDYTLDIEISPNAMAIDGKLGDLNTLKEKAKQIAKKDTPVKIRIDKNVRYEIVAQTLDVLSENGLHRVELITLRQ